MRQNISMSSDSLNPPFDKVWDFETDAGFPNYSLTASDYALFASNLNGDLYALNIGSGKKAGSISSGSIEYISSPVLTDDRIFFSFNAISGGGLTCYSIRDGEKLWNRKLFRTTSPMLFIENSIITNDGNYLKKFNSTDGKLIWQTKTPSSLNLHTFVLSDSSVFADDESGVLYKINLTDGKIMQSIKLPAQITSDIVSFNERLYFTSNNEKFMCLNNNLEMIFSSDIVSYCIAGFSVRDSVILFGCINGNLYCFDNNTGNIRWQKSFGSTFHASPLIHGNFAFIGCYDKIFYCFNLSNGEILWTYATDGRIRSTPLIWGKYIFISSDDRKIYCFK